MREIIAWRFIQDRRTGQPVGLLTPVFKEDWPYEVPAAHQRMWRYIDLWKFEDMLRASALYFRRADKLSKRFSFESELRLVRPVHEGEHVMVDDKKDFGKLIRVEVSGLIDQIVANKNISEAVLDHIRNLAAKYCGGAQVLRSTVEPRIR